jgi:hypothetical protein
MKREEENPVLHRQARAGHARRGRLQRDEPTSAMAGKAGLQPPVQPGQDWTVVLRRQPARMVDGQPQGGYTDAFELICCDCGDDPGLDYRDVSLRLRQIRGPYPIAAGIAAYDEHVRHHRRQAGRLSESPATGTGA